MIDTSALVAILRLEAEAEILLRALVAADRCLMSALSMLETATVLSGGRATPAIWAPLDEFLAKADVEIVPFDRDQAGRAREAFLRFGKGRHPAGLNFGDCASYALSASRNLPLLFKGEGFGRTDLVPALTPMRRG